MHNTIIHLQQQLSKRYNFRKQQPIHQTGTYYVYNGTLIDLGIQVTIKILTNPHPQLSKYLKKLKQSKVENVIKIYEIYDISESLCITTQKVTFHNFKFAMEKCKKLDDFETVFMAKVLLNTHVDLMRTGVNWFGSFQDIQFTDNGLKLSWNNGISYTQENPFPRIISTMAGKLQNNEFRMIPYAKSKVIDDLIKVSSANASQISLNANMQKKQKVSKTMGKGWMALKQYKVEFEYYEQVVIFAVHKQHGFVRVKSYKAGQINQDLLSLSKTKSSFCKVLSTYNELNRTYIVSQYSNQGSLFNYLNKLKANSISLKEQQIEFLYFSLFEPLKIIQESSIKSIAMLHIKNIFLQNGILKIGQPVPINQQIIAHMKQKSQSADFYHPKFKTSPKSRSSEYDTYSLGVLLYRIMYSEYPIFPKGKVHMPATPSYNLKLKNNLEILLNQEGSLKDLSNRIKVNQKVQKQIRQNKRKMMKQKSRHSSSTQEQTSLVYSEIQKQQQKKSQKKSQQPSQLNFLQKQDVEQDQQQSCCKLCCMQLKDPVKQNNIMYNALQRSPYSRYRQLTKVTLILLLYSLLFYYFYLPNSILAIDNHSKLTKMNVTISTLNYEISVNQPNNFYKVFNVTDRSLSSLKNIGCFINRSDLDYTSIAKQIFYIIYVSFSIALVGIILIFKGVQIYRFDLLKTYYNMSNLITNFNLTNYILFNLFICSLINHHFLVFNQVFKSTLPVCLGVQSSYDYAPTHHYYQNPLKFIYIYGGSLLLHLLIITLHFAMVVKTQSTRYTRIFNPILLLLPFLLGYTIAARIGAVKQFYYPSILSDFELIVSFFVKLDHTSMIGMLPQIIFLLQLILDWIVDGFFWLMFDKSRMMTINDVSTNKIAIET